MRDRARSKITEHQRSFRSVGVSDRIVQQIADLLAPRAKNEISEVVPRFSRQRVKTCTEEADCARDPKMVEVIQFRS